MIGLNYKNYDSTLRVKKNYYQIIKKVDFYVSGCHMSYLTFTHPTKTNFN
jgi:hypothetical protein